MTAAAEKAERIDFDAIVALRDQWRIFHQRQDRENADTVFRTAGVDLTTDLDLKFFPHVFRQKLNEFGRDWERTISAEALREGASFYRAQMLVSVDSVNDLQSSLGSAFETIGAPLFFESNGLHTIENGVWDCLFYFVLKAEHLLDEVGLETLPGVMSAPKTLRIA